jgi:hypothetical protein
VNDRFIAGALSIRPSGTDGIARAPLPVSGQADPSEIPNSIPLEPNEAIMERRQ